MIIIYNGATTSVMGTAYDRIYFKVSTDNGATWGTGFEYSAGGKSVEAHYERPSCEIGDSDTLHTVYAQSANLMQRALSSADVLQTERDTGFDVTAPDTSILTIGKGQTFSRSATTRLRFPYKDGSADTHVLRFDAAADPSTFASDAIDGTNDQLDDGGSQLALDGSTIHAMWVRSVDSDLYTDNDEDADTWNSAASSFTGTVTLISANIYTRSGSKVLAHVFDDAGTVKYDEDSLAAAAPSGTGDQTAEEPTQAGAGAETFAGAGAQVGLAPSQSGTGLANIVLGAGAQAAAEPTQAAAGAETFAGAGAQTADQASQAGTGVQHPQGAGIQAGQEPTQAATGAESFAGAGAATAAAPS
ncbi:MAG TPA: hypothetical protein VF987_05275, partial [Rhodospirillales bacterium]